jgi:hypothetical protein
LGGPEVVTIEEFLRKLHRLYYDKEARVIHLPRQAVMRTVTFAERYLSQLMPFNAGQLSAFTEDGTVTANHLYDKRLPYMKDLDSILRFLTRDGSCND